MFWSSRLSQRAWNGPMLLRVTDSPEINARRPRWCHHPFSICHPSVNLLAQMDCLWQARGLLPQGNGTNSSLHCREVRCQTLFRWQSKWLMADDEEMMGTMKKWCKEDGRSLMFTWIDCFRLRVGYRNRGMCNNDVFYKIVLFVHQDV